MTDVITPSSIRDMAGQLHPDLVNLRRYFHRYPELSWEEAHTSQIIAEQLQDMGLTVLTSVGGYGIVAQLSGTTPGPTIAYRADMDALPLQDDLEGEYRSTVLGAKHACGHDAHMAIAIGVAKVLSVFKESLSGTIRFLFQPAEEALDGAQAMIADNALADPLPSAIFGLHVFPLPAGTIGLTPGCCLAGMEEFRVKFSAPDMMLPSLIHKSIPALTALSHQTPPTTPQAFDKLIQSMVTDDNLKSNIYISCWQSAGDFGSHAHITGLASTSDSSARLEAHRRIKQTLDRIVRGTGVTYEFWTSFSNPPMFNDAALTQQIRPFVEEVIGVEKVAWFNAPYPFAHEDFALFAAQVPAVFMWLGTANAELGIHSLLHTSNFDIDESALLTGTAVMAYLLLKLSYQLSE